MYKEIALTTLKEETVYRAELIVSFIGSIISLSVWFFVWSAIFKASGLEVLKGMTLPIMITYISINAVLHFYNRSALEYWIEDDVRTGFITILMTKPVNYPIYYLFRDVGRLAFSLLTRGLPILIIASLLLHISMPSNPLFFVSAALGFFVNFLMLFLTGMSSFWSSGSIWGLRYTRSIVSDIMSGSMIPLILFPEWLRQVAYALPFQAIYSTPLLIYVGQTSGSDIFSSILLQLAWIAILSVVVFVVWRKAQKKTVSQGG
ncbi:MAG: ABC-2 family transporter protein [Candidatus Aenigmatarchaeota archaeon]